MALRVVGSSPIIHPDLKGGIVMSRYDWNLNEEEAERRTNKNMDGYYMGRDKDFYYDGDGHYTSRINPHIGGYRDKNGYMEMDM